MPQSACWYRVQNANECSVTGRTSAGQVRREPAKTHQLRTYIHPIPHHANSTPRRTPANPTAPATTASRDPCLHDPAPFPADPVDEEELGEPEDPEALAPELFAEEDGGGVGKDRDVLVAACAQNCCATPSAAARSPGHDVAMQSTRPDVKRVALFAM